MSTFTLTEATYPQSFLLCCLQAAQPAGEVEHAVDMLLPHGVLPLYACSALRNVTPGEAPGTRGSVYGEQGEPAGAAGQREGAAR